MALFRNRPPANPLSRKGQVPPLQAPKPVPPAPLPEFLRENDIRTSLAPDAVITGKLAFTTPTRIEGKLKGEVHCTDLLIIGPSAVVEGLAKADELRIEGSVEGEIVDTRKVEIRRTGRFTGRLQARSLSIQEGGFFDGECRMGSAPAALNHVGGGRGQT